MALRHDPSLIPLSHDHHHGLVRVFMIRQAVRARVGLSEETAATQEFWTRNLVPHFEAEELVLFPALRAAHCALDLVERLTGEHARLREMAASLDASPERLSGLADLLESHIRCEERELFTQYQAQLPEAERRAVETQIRRLLDRPDDLPKACELPRHP